MNDSELRKRLLYQQPSAAQIERQQKIRELALALAEEINQTCPGCQETRMAITGLEDVVLWAAKSIVLHGS